MSDRTTVRIDVVSHSMLEILKKTTGETPSKIIRRLIFEGKISNVSETGATRYSITVRMDFSTRERVEIMKSTHGIDSSELIRRLLWTRALSDDQFNFEPTEEITNAAAANKTFEYIACLRQTARKYRELAAKSTPDGQYFHEASVKAVILENQSEKWFNALGEYLRVNAEGTSEHVATDKISLEPGI